MGMRLAKKVLVIGWDAADWKVINPLLDAGKMPALESLINKGVIGNLATLDPPLSPMLWTSIATGKNADKHGVLGFTETDPNSGGIRPVLSTSRKVKAIWNILTQHDLRTHVVGWWPSHPAEHINGISISNFYQQANDPMDEPWPMMPGTVYPKEKADLFSSLRIHPDELTEAHLLPFVPKAGEIDQEKDKRLAMLSKIIADCASIHSAATWIMENEEWDFIGIYYDAIDHFCHGFMKFHPPRMKGLPKKYFDLYKDVINGSYLFHDMMLERLIKLAGPNTTIMLISDHGFHSDHLRPRSLPKEPAAPALEHSPYGIICLSGDHIKKDERIYGASVLDITPTLLTLFGLPVGSDMDGHPLVQSFEEQIEPETISSWEDIPGESGMYPPLAKSNKIASDDVLDQLVALGYIEKPDKDRQKAAKQTTREGQYNLARVYIHSRRYEEALPILEQLYENDPAEDRFALRLAACYQSLTRMSDCRSVIDKIRKRTKKDIPSLDLLEGTALLGENKPRKALDHFRKVEEVSPHIPKLHLQIGRGYLQLNRWNDAERAFRKALDFDGDDANAHHGLGISLLRSKQYESAIEEILTAVGLRYHFPIAHYHLGEALAKMSDHQRAAEAFEVCLSMAPNIGKARQWLIKLYEENLNEPSRAQAHKESVENMDVGTIYVVSGLPRSGTSMMMQMLEQGGMEVFADNERISDESNPKGYFEHQAVKQLMRNKSWLSKAEGKAVKVIAPLLPHLPPRYKYKVIFMERDIREIVMSQQKMLERVGKADSKNYPVTLEISFQKSLEQVKSWIGKQSNFEVLFVPYGEVVADPSTYLSQINEFYDHSPDEKKMAKAIDKALYRTKNEKVN